MRTTDDCGVGGVLSASKSACPSTMRSKVVLPFSVRPVIPGEDSTPVSDSGAVAKCSEVNHWYIRTYRVDFGPSVTARAFSSAI